MAAGPATAPVANPEMTAEIYLFDTDLLIFMIRGLKRATNRRARKHEQAAGRMDRCHKAPRRPAIR